jgi:hypothetical protein
MFQQGSERKFEEDKDRLNKDKGVRSATSLRKGFDSKIDTVDSAKINLF